FIVVEQLAEIGEAFDLPTCPSLMSLAASGEHLFVDVTERDDFGIGKVLKAIDMRDATPVDTNDPNADDVIAVGRSCPGSERRGGHYPRGGLEKTASIERLHLSSPVLKILVHP